MAGRLGTMATRSTGRSNGRGKVTALRVLRVALIVGAIGAVAGALGLAGLFIYYGHDPRLPTVESLRANRPKQVTRQLGRNGARVARRGPGQRAFVPCAE